MAPSDTSADSYCGFLSIPTEIRCHIYDYLLSEPQTITVSAGYLTVFGNRIQDRSRKTEIPGLPLDLTPLARPHYDASLLSVAKPHEIPVDHGLPSDQSKAVDQLGMPAPLALLLTCRMINDELNDWKDIKAARAGSKPKSVAAKDLTENEDDGLTLHVSYPYGVLVLKSMYPYLLKQARRVYVTGYYVGPKVIKDASSTTSDDDSDDENIEPSGSFEVARTFSSSFRSSTAHNSGTYSRDTTSRRVFTIHNRPRLVDSLGDVRQKRAAMIEKLFLPCSPTTKTLASDTLFQLVRTLFPPKATQLAHLTVRIVYPGEEAYNSVWSNEYSPVVHILRGMCGGKIDMTAKRGQPGTGMAMIVRPQPEARLVRTSWENWRTSGPRRSILNAGDYDQFLFGA